MIIEFTLLYFSPFLRSDNVTLRAGVKSVMFSENIIMEQMSRDFSILYVEISQKGYLGVNNVNTFLIQISQVS